MTRLMTYDEISSTFGITRNSARQLVGRRRWMRRKGNDGRARVEVPLDALPPANEAGSEAAHEGLHDAPHETPHEAPSMLLKHLVERLEAEVAELRPKAFERDMALAQADTLRQALADMRQERDAWRSQAERLSLPAPASAWSLWSWLERVGQGRLRAREG